MSKSFVTVGGDSLAEQRLVRRVNAGIAARRGDDAEYSAHWEQRICVRPDTMSRFEFARFILWHRQFRGLATPGLPFVVGTARRAARTVLKPALIALPVLSRWLKR